MLFNSLEFVLFFPLVAIIYFRLSQRYQTLHLLIASCLFYMAFIPAYILILGLTIVVDYFAGIYLEKTTGRARKVLLVVSIVVTSLILAVFKYYYFVTDNFVALTGLWGWQLTGPSLDIILPIGLSFHTFQSLSYVVEVYRGNQKAEKNFITYATFVMFFPQLVAGPIERPQNLLHQFHQLHRPDFEQIISGLKRMGWGFFKKLVVADRLALYVNDVFSAPTQHGNAQLLIATIFFAYQIYCDFSGYSDIAIGSARVLGFKLMENFDRPYAALSVGEFWKRWHMSLSTWFKDYVYVPLGGNRVSVGRWVFNILVTFGLSGLWHGASWTYVVWGLLNGVYLIFGQLTLRLRHRVFLALGIRESAYLRKLSMLGTTFVLTCIAWIFFRAHSASDAVQIIHSMCTGSWKLSSLATEHFLLRYFPIAILAILILEVGQYLDKINWPSRILGQLPIPVRGLIYSCLIVIIILLGVYQEQPFIYFQF